MSELINVLLTLGYAVVFEGSDCGDFYVLLRRLGSGELAHCALGSTPERALRHAGDWAAGAIGGVHAVSECPNCHETGGTHRSEDLENCPPSFSIGELSAAYREGRLPRPLFTTGERVAALESWAETATARLGNLEARLDEGRLGISLAAADALWKDGEATGRDRGTVEREYLEARR